MMKGVDNFNLWVRYGPLTIPIQSAETWKEPFTTLTPGKKNKFTLCPSRLAKNGLGLIMRNEIPERSEALGCIWTTLPATDAQSTRSLKVDKPVCVRMCQTLMYSTLESQKMKFYYAPFTCYGLQFSQMVVSASLQEIKDKEWRGRNNFWQLSKYKKQHRYRFPVLVWKKD